MNNKLLTAISEKDISGIRLFLRAYKKIDAEKAFCS
jgi:hypothetical protein